MDDGRTRVSLHQPTPAPVVAFFARRRVPGTRLAASYAVPRDQIREAWAVLRPSLTLEPGTSFNDGAEPYAMYQEEEAVVRVPRFYGIAQFGAPEVDERVDGAPLGATPVDPATLRPWQRVVLPHLIERLDTPPLHGGIVQAGCGMGKTYLAIAALRATNRRTVVLTHRACLQDQWVRSLRQFAPDLTVGVVRGGRCQEADVMVVMIQTLVGARHPRDAFKDVGLVVVDECHHLCARTFQEAMAYFPARRVMGLSATLARGDGNERGVMWLLGPPVAVVHRVPGAADASVTVRMVRVPGVPRAYPRVKKAQLLFTYQLRDLCHRADRCRRIVELVRRQVDDGRHVLVISARRDLLTRLRAALVRDMDPAEVCVFVGETSQRATQARDDALQGARAVLATEHMVKEGFNHPIIDTVLLATPISVRGGSLEQAVGRCQREHPAKAHGNQVIDLVDHGPTFLARASARRTWYQRQGFVVMQE